MRGAAPAVAAVLAAVALVSCGPDPAHRGESSGGGPIGAASATPDGPGTSQPTEDAVATDCSGTTDAEYPDVIDATATAADDGTFEVSATICSAYDTDERYADAFRVIDPASGDVLGVRDLTHPHANEQPFTRSTSGVEIPEGVTEVVVEGRDLANGWGGATVTLDVDG